jgi:DNA-binding CsgD family transcriptional regulator
MGNLNDKEKYDKLSIRQQQVLGFIAIGKSSKEISVILGTTTKTIDSHRNNLIHRLDVHKSSELTLFAVRAGIIKGYSYNES